MESALSGLTCGAGGVCGVSGCGGVVVVMAGWGGGVGVVSVGGGGGVAGLAAISSRSVSCCGPAAIGLRLARAATTSRDWSLRTGLAESGLRAAAVRGGALLIVSLMPHARL